jgi:hypothetical protein
MVRERCLGGELLPLLELPAELKLRLEKLRGRETVEIWPVAKLKELALG